MSDSFEAAARPATVPMTVSPRAMRRHAAAFSFRAGGHDPLAMAAAPCPASMELVDTVLRPNALVDEVALAGGLRRTSSVSSLLDLTA